MLGEKLQWGAAEQGVLKVIDSNWVNLGGIVSVGVSGEAVTHRSFWFYRWPATQNTCSKRPWSQRPEIDAGTNRDSKECSELTSKWLLGITESW